MWPRTKITTLEGPFAKTLCLYCSTGEGPEAPQLQRLCACTAPPGRAQKLRKAPGSCPEALGSSRKPHLHRLCACTAPSGRAQKLPHWKDFVLLLLRREVPKSAQTHSAHNAHRSSPQCSLEKTTAPAVLILNKNIL